MHVCERRSFVSRTGVENCGGDCTQGNACAMQGRRDAARHVHTVPRDTMCQVVALRRVAFIRANLYCPLSSTRDTQSSLIRGFARVALAIIGLVRHVLLCFA